MSCFRGASLVKGAGKSSDEVPPSFAPSSHRAKERCRGAVPQIYPEPRGTADGPLASLPTLPGVRWYLLSCGLILKVQPYGETGQLIPGRIPLLFLMQFEPNTALLHVCVPEAVSLCLVRNSSSHPGGRGMVAGHVLCRTIQLWCSTGDPLAGQDRMGC